MVLVINWTKKKTENNWYQLEVLQMLEKYRADVEYIDSKRREPQSSVGPWSPVVVHGVTMAAMTCGSCDG